MYKIPKEMKMMKFKIFLNVFGLKLDNYEDIDNISTINILKDNKKVGELNLDKNQESIIAHFDDNKSLYAGFSSDIWKNDWYSPDKNEYYYNSKINFQFLTGFHTNLNGDIAFKGIISSERNNICNVSSYSSYIKGSISNNSRIELDLKKIT